VNSEALRLGPPEAPVDAHTNLSAARFAIYVHFPWCLSKCPYCDFASIAAKVIPEAEYVEAVLAELKMRLLERSVWPEVNSIFIGGGTPSLWHPSFVEQLLSELQGSFRFQKDLEITLEANPGAADAERFAGYLRAGVNRLSMGVQSFQLKTLQALGRAHDGPTAHRAYESARKAGFQNVSLDFIYGVHGQTLEEALRDATEAASLGSEHLSAYALTLDLESLAEEVPLARQLRRGELHLPPDETVLSMQRAYAEQFAKAGLTRYEISNYARLGFHSRHNAAYWTGGEYLAIGAGATGFLKTGSGGFRYSNHRSAEKYFAAIEGRAVPEKDREPLNAQQLFSERVAMGLRLVMGVDVESVAQEFGQPLPSETTARHLISAGLLLRNKRWSLTPSGFDVHSAIAARLM
jgi:putative oxygen-independent coproporphyrinogen III oxidase